MSDNQGSSAPQEGLPSWIAAGVLGLALGAGITVVAMRGMGYVRMDHEPAVATQEVTGSARPPTTSGPPGGGMPAGSGGMAAMMGPGGGGGGGANSPGARAKRTLTSLVGKLDVATKGIQFQLTPEQSAQIAAKVAELQKAEKLPGEAAEKELAALEGILTDEQKATLAVFELPRGGRPGGGGGGPGGGPGGGGAPGPGNVPPPMGMGMAMAPPDENENPFRQEANQKRAQELLARLGGAPTEAAVGTEPAAPAAPAADAKPAATEESKTPPADEAKPAADTKPAAPAADAKPATDDAKPATPATTTPPATETKPPANP